MADLQNPIMPVVDTSAVTKGLALWAEGRKQAQLQELAYQKLAQDAALQQEHFGLTRQQLAQQYELQRHQMDATDAEANLRNAQADYYTNVKTEDTKKKQESLGLLGPYNQAVDSIPLSQIGTDDGANALALINTDPKFAPIFELPGGRALANRAQMRQRFAENRRAQDNVILNNRLNQTLVKKGIDPTQLDFLQKDDKGGFVPNNVWNVNDSGDPFLTIQPANTTAGTAARIVPPAEYIGKITPSEKGWISATLDKDEAKRLLQMKNMVDSFSTGKSGAPLPAMQAAAAQDQQTSQDQLALIWARNNQDDPRAAAIFKKLGVQ